MCGWQVCFVGFVDIDIEAALAIQIEERFRVLGQSFERGLNGEFDQRRVLGWP
jgi:hypothetical protein